MTYPKRLIEVDLPIKKISAHARREKSIRHGHISTLHIWPARRPLAACRAALIATLLPDPGDKEKRDELLLRLGGRVEKTLKKKKLQLKDRMQELARRGKPGYGDIYLEDLARRVGPYLRARISQAAEDTGSYWYTAWTVAGRPELK